MHIMNLKIKLFLYKGFNAIFSYHIFPLGPLRQTFTHNPLQQTPPIAAASTKNKATDSKERPWKDTIG